MDKNLSAGSGNLGTLGTSGGGTDQNQKGTTNATLSTPQEPSQKKVAESTTSRVSENTTPSEPPVQVSILRNLSDKLYDKRKAGALEVEQLVRDWNAANEEEKIKNLIQHLSNNFSESNQSNQRKGGLIALAGVAIGLGNNVGKYLVLLIPPVLKTFTDQDIRIRYYACESLYNIAKVARGSILIFFNEIFDILCKV